MEINTEINKVFGEEMAKLFAAQISEEELKAKAQEAWKKINYKDSSYWSNTKQSALEEEIQRELLARVKDEIYTILNSEEGEKCTRELAQTFVDRIRVRGSEKIIENASDLLASLYGGAQYNGTSLQYVINQTIQQAMER